MTGKERRKRVYVCPEPSCVHHHPSHALGNLTGIKTNFYRKYGEKKWKCDKCSKKYAVQFNWKAHSKTCGSQAYRCNCSILFSRRDSFITHRAFCYVLAVKSAKVKPAANPPEEEDPDQKKASDDGAAAAVSSPLAYTSATLAPMQLNPGTTKVVLFLLFLWRLGGLGGGVDWVGKEWTRRSRVRM